MDVGFFGGNFPASTVPSSIEMEAFSLDNEQEYAAYYAALYVLSTFIPLYHKTLIFQAFYNSFFFKSK